METNSKIILENRRKNTKKGISLIVLIITMVVAVLLLAVVILAVSRNNPSESANEAVFRNDFVVLQNELTASKLNEKINDFESKEDINVSMSDPLINKWLPSLADSPLEGKVEICSGEVVFVIDDQTSEEYEWAKKMAGSEKVYLNACAEAPKVFSPEIEANIGSGEIATSAVVIKAKSGVSDNSIEHYYEYSLDRGKTFARIMDGNNNDTLTFDGVVVREIVQIRVVANVDGKEVKSRVSEFDVHIDKTGTIAPIITAVNGYISGNWTGDNVEVLITSATPDSDETLEYSLNGGTWTTYNESTHLIFNEDGEYSIKARAINTNDVIGPESTTFKVCINKTLPEAPTISRVDGVESGAWSSKSPVNLTISSNSMVSYYEYSTDGGNSWTRWEPGSDSIKIYDEGVTNVIARAYNFVDRVGATSNAFVVKIDTVRPVVTTSLTSTTNSITVNARAADENGSGVDSYIFYKNDEELVVTKDNSYTFNNLLQATSYKISCVAIDTAGNRSPVYDNSIYTQSIETPTIKIDNENWTNLNVTATITKYNNQATNIEYQIVGNDKQLSSSEWIQYTNPIVITKNCKIYARAVDTNDQLSTSAVYMVSNIDKINPDSDAPTATATSRTITVTSKQKDGDDTVEYANSGINEDRIQYALKTGDLWSEFQYDNKFDNLTQDTEYVVKTRVYDNAGNYRESAETEVRTSALQPARIYFTYSSINGTTYNPGTVTKNSVYVRLDDSDKMTATYKSKNGSAQFVSQTIGDTLINTSGTTTIITENTDGYNVVNEEYEVIIDNVPPEVAHIRVVSPESGRYEQGEKITLEVEWTENVTCRTLPLLTVAFGTGTPKEATFVSLVNNIVTYEYVIEHNDNGYMSVSDYVGGEMLDSVGNVGTGRVRALEGSRILASNEFTITLAATPPKGGTVTGVGKAYYFDDITITAVPNEGYQFNKWTTSSENVILNNTNSPNTSFSMPAENVTLTANFEGITYTIKYDANTGRGREFESIHKYDVAKTLAKNTYEKPGYIFTGWSRQKDATEPEFLDEQEVVNLTSEDEAVVTLYAVWQVGVSEYKIEHYVENVNSTAYILRETENLTGTTDIEIAAVPHDYTGFYFDEENEKNKVTGIISGEGNLTLKLYYNRVTYNLSVDPNGGTFAGVPGISTISGKYETSVTLPNPYKQGYVFNGWVIDGSGSMSSNRFTFDAADSKVIAQWTPGRSYYKVEHYKEKVDSTGYDLYETEDLSGVTESIVKAKIKEYTGFEANTNIDGTLLETELLPDNSVVLKVFYVRKTYNLTVEPNGGTYKDVTNSVLIPGKYETLERIERPTPPEGYEVTYNGNGGIPEKETDYTTNLFTSWTKFGKGELNEDQTVFKYLDGDASITAVYFNDGLTLAGASRQGYDFNGWYLGTTRVGTAGDKYTPTKPVVLNATWLPRSDTKYRVEHYRENLTKDGYELYETDELEGITDTQAVAISKDYEGFTFDSSIEGSVLKGNINPDGSLVLKVYYTRNVHNLTLSVVPSASGTVQTAKSYIYGETVEIKATPNSGYLFDKWNVTTSNVALQNALDATTTFVMPDGDVSITGEFVGITYTIVYDINRGSQGTMSNSICTYGQTYSLPSNKYTRPGYSFIGWNRNKDANTAEFLDEAEISNLTTVNGDIITLYAIWSAGKTEYSVEHYTENLNGGYTLHHTDNLIGVVDAVVFAEPTEITGFTYDNDNENQVFSGVNEYQKNLTLKLYYTRNTYYLTVDPNTGIFKGKTDESVLEGKYQEVISLPNPTKVGYLFNGWLTEGIGSISGTTYKFDASNEKITATFKASDYTLAFMYNGATSGNQTETKTVTYDSVYGELPSPEKRFTVSYNATGGTATTSNENVDAIYLFSGWYLKSDFANLSIISSETKVKTASDHFAYAKWLGGQVTLPEASKTGYHIEGWYSNSNLLPSTRVGSAGDKYTASSDVTLYAKWSPNTNTPYKVEYYQENVTANGFTLKETVNLTGTTDSEVSAEIKTYTGFEYDKNNENSLVKANILPDGTLTLKVYYVRSYYNLEVDPNGGKFRGTNATTTISKKYQQTEIIEDPVVPTAYTVSYELNGGSTSLIEANTTSKFIFTGWSVSGKGTFNVETKTYTYDNGTGYFVANYSNSDIVLPEPTKQGYTFDAWYKEPALQNKVGEAGNSVSIDSSTVYYAKWIPRTDTKYVVKHYLQNIYDNSYTLHETQTLYGTTATTAQAVANTYSGFSFDSSISVTSGTIYPDGSLVLSMYYSRNLYSLSVNPNGGTWNNKTAISVINKRHGTELTIDDPTPAADATVSYELNGGSAEVGSENIYSGRVFTGWTHSGSGTFDPGTKKFTYGLGSSTLRASYESLPVTLPSAEKQGYIFAGWYEDSNFESYAGDAGGQYASENDITLYAKWDNALDTYYKVEHYLENVNEGTYTLQETVPMNGETDSTVTAQPLSYTGYTYDENVAGTVKTGSIAPDGSLVLKLYYTRNSYNLTVNPNGGTWRNSTSNTTVTKKHGQTETIENPQPPQKYIVSYDLNSGNLSELLPQNTDATKTFTSWTKTGKGTFSAGSYTFDIGAGTLKANYTTNAVTLPTPTRVGYTFKGWYDSETADNGTGNLIGSAGASYVPGSSLTLYAKWEANKVTYKIEHYTEDLENGTYTLHSTDSLSWYTDSTVNASSKSITGFLYDSTNTSNVTTGTVAGDGSLVLKLYYTRNSYTLSLAISPATAGTVTTSGKYKYNQQVPINAVINNGYTFKNWATTNSSINIVDTSSSSTSFKMPASDVSITANCSVNGYKISYQLNGGVETAENPTSYTTLTNTITLNNPRRDEYVFLGWTTPEDTNPNRNVTIPKGSIGDKTFIANWQYAVVDAVDRTSEKVDFSSENGTFTSQGGAIIIHCSTSGFTVNAQGSIGTNISIASSIDGSYTNVARATTNNQTLQYNVSSACYVKIDGPGTYSGSVSIADLGNVYISDKLPVYTRTAYLNDGSSVIYNVETYRKFDPKYLPEVAPTRSGYIFKYWSTDSNAFPGNSGQQTGQYGYMTGDEEIYAIWAKSTVYTTQYYRQNVGQDAYDLYESVVNETLEGDTVTAVEKDYTASGFTIDKGVQGTKLTGTVLADGSLILKVYYSRNKYNLTVKPNGGSWNNTTSDSVISNTHGTVLDIPVPTRAGYTFSGWTKTGLGSITQTAPIASTTQRFTYGLGNGIITAKWTAITVGYKVQHYRQKTDLTFELVDTENKSAVTATTVTATPKSYSGFTHAVGYADAVESGTVAGDGSLVLKVYYTRNTITLYINPNGGAYDGSSGTFSTTGLYQTTYNVDVPSQNAPGYTVTYNGKGGTPAVATTTTTKSFTGYTKTGSGNYNSNTRVFEFGTASGTLTANYANDSYVLPGATRVGYEFNGWYLDEDCTNSAGTDGDSFIANKNTNLYAGWTPAGGIQYKVQHYLENVDGTYPTTPNNTDTYKDGVTEETVTAKSRTYTGYSVNTSVSGTVASGTVAGDGSLILKLYYPRNSYTLTLTASTGGTAKTSGSYKYGKTVTIEATPSSGYSFNSWTTTTTGVTISNTANATTTFTMPASNVNITANFKVNPYVLTVNPGGEKYTQNYNTTKSVSAPTSSYKVSYDSNGGTSFSASTSNRGFKKWSLSGSGSISSDSSNPTTYTYGAGDGTLTASYNDKGASIVLPTPTKTGYTFKGWYDSETSNNGSGNLIGEAGANYEPSANITLFAKWQINGYTLTVNPGGTTYTRNYNTTLSVTAPAQSFKIVYDVNGGTAIADKQSARTFESWTKTGSGTISSSTANPTTYTFGAGDGTLTANYSTSGEAYNLPEAKRPGYRFDGWYSSETNNNGSGNLIGAAGASYSPTANTTLYAKWTIIDYTLTVNPGSSQYTGHYGDTKSISLSPKYTINFDSNGGSAVSSIDSARTVTGWTLDGSGSLSSTTANPTTFTYGEGNATVTATYSTTGTAITLPSNPTKTGYSFKGWYSSETNNNGSGTLIGSTGETYTPSGNNASITLFAKWQINSYTVSTSVSPTGGGTTSGAGSYNYNSSVTVSASPNSGYTFSGWYKGDTQVSTNADYTFTMGAGNVSLTAKFTASKVNYTVNHYVMNTSGNYPTSATASETKSANTDSSLTLANLKKTTAAYNTTNGIAYSYGQVDGTTVTTTKVKGDGSLVINLYYKRYYGKLTTAAGTYVSSVTAKNGVTYYYGAEVPSLTATLNTTAGYNFTFSKWESDQSTYLADITTNPTGKFNWPAMPEDTSVTLTAKATRSPKVITITLLNTNATTNGATAVYLKYNTGVYKESSCTNKMTTSANAVSVPSRTGYTFNGWYSGNTKLIDSSGKITSSFTNTFFTQEANLSPSWTAQDVNYKVEHYVMNTSGNYPTSATSTETLSAKADSSVTLADLKKTTSTYKVTNGIAYSYGKVGGTTVTSATIAADGTTVIKLYYKRYYGYLTTAKGSNIKSVTTQNEKKYYYGATVDTLTAELNTASAGYSINFDKWISDNTTYMSNKTSNPLSSLSWPAMPEGTKIKLTASATNTANTNTTYKVEHYVMNTSGNYPTSVTSSYTDSLTGTTDATLTLANLKRTSLLVDNGIIYSHGQVGGTTVTTTTISGDGTRVIKLYYKRTYGKLTTAAGNYVSSVTTQSAVKYYYGAEVPSLTATLNTTAGYNFTFQSWASSNSTYMAAKTANPTGKFTWPAMPENTSITLTANASRSPKVITITLLNTNATTNGATAVYLKYGDGVYKESSCTNKMTTSANAVSVPSRTGYTFNGWYSGNTKLIDSSGKITSSFTNTFFTAEANLSPSWTINTSKLTIDPNGGTVSVTPANGTAVSITTSTDYTQNYNTTLSYGKPTRADVGTGGSVRYITYHYCDGVTANTTAQTRDSVTAKYTFDSWEKSTTFYGTLSSTTGAGTYTYPANKGVTSTIKAKWSSTTTTTEGTVTLPTPTWTGHTFNGWYTAETGGTKIGNGGDSYVPSTNTTNAYAQWTTHTSKFTIDPKGGTVSVTPGGSTARNITTSTTYTQNYNTTLSYGKPTKSDLVNTDATYTVTYDYNGGSGTKTSGTSYKKTTTTYTFSSWKKSTTFYGTLTSTTGAGSYTYPANNNVTSSIEAQWTSSSTTATSIPSPQPDASRAGWTLSSWNTKADGSGTTITPSTYKPTANIKIYAIWTQNTSSLKIDPKGGTWGGSTSVTTKTQKSGTTLSVPKATRSNSVNTDATYKVTYDYNEGSGSPASANASKKTTTSYTFSSWTKSTTFYGTLTSTTADATYTFPNNNNVTSTITANWTSTSSTATEQVTLPTPTRKGYTFNGWYSSETNNNGSGNLIGAGGAKYTPTANVTLYAKWTVNSYTFTRSANGSGSITGTASGSINYGTSVTVTASANSGYRFVGWYTSTTDTVAESTSATYTFTMPASNYTIYARFQATSLALVKRTYSGNKSQYISSNNINASSGDFYIYVPAGGAGMQFLMSSGTCSISRSTSVNGTYTALSSKSATTSTAVRYVSTYDSGYYKITVSGGTVGIYNATGILVTQTTGTSSNQCSINDQTRISLTQLGRATTSEYALPSSFTSSQNNASTLTLTIPASHAYVVYCPAANFVFKSSTTSGISVYYQTGLYTLTTTTGGLGTAKATVTSSTTYKNTGAGYVALYLTGSQTAKVTAPNGGAISIDYNLPLVQYSGGTHASSAITISSGGTTTIHPYTRTVKMYYRTYTGSTAYTAGLSRATSKTGTFTSLATLQQKNITAYGNFTTGYHYKLQGYGTFWFIDSNGSLVRMATY